MELLERQVYLDELDGLLRQTGSGRGYLLFLGGEAGVGKSELVRYFADHVQQTTRVLTGACDPLSTPRPLGPLIDISEMTGGDVASLLHAGAPRADLFRAVLAEFAASPGTLVLLEDAHWADEATLDLLRYLGRRLDPVPTLVVVTYRDDEVGAGHPLLRVLGDLATTKAARRLSVRPLSLDAVTQLAHGSQIDPATLYQLTGGNPFYATEVLALGEAGLPPTVRDAVLAHASRLTPGAMQALEMCAVIGTPIEPWLLLRVGVESGPISECIQRGILVQSGSSVSFRHELSRQAVLESLDPVSRSGMHQAVLAVLRESSNSDFAQLAHHAEGAGDREAVLQFATAAAEKATAFKSHREAAAQYARALRFAEAMPPEQRAQLLESLSYECYLTDQSAEAVAAGEAARELWRHAGDRLREGDAERKLTPALWVAGRNLEALGASLKAIRILEELPQGPELAKAYCNLSQLRMTSWYSEEAISWGEKAISLAEEMGDMGTLIHALINVGTAQAELNDERGPETLKRSLALALEHGFEDQASRAFANLCWNHIERFQYMQAAPYLVEGIAFCTDHDLELMRLYLLTWRAVCLMYQGHWAEAKSMAQSVLGHSQLSPHSQIRALVALGRVQSRQGDPQAASTLDRALELASPIGELQRLGPVRTARAEAAWLSGDWNRVEAETTDHYEIAAHRKHRWLVGELAFWRWRAGRLAETQNGLFEPFALQISGDWRAAAAHWRASGYPYESASALADSDDEADLRYALAEFNRLGAVPAAARVSHRLREIGGRSGRRRVFATSDAMETPQTLYAKSGDVNIAYQTIGDGPLDLVFVMGWVSNLEYLWTGPSAPFLQRLASFSRLILFDKRGTGLSDRVAHLPTLEQRMDDVRAVMDAVGSTRAALIGISEGASMCSLFAATYPERTMALVIYGGFARRLWAPDYPWAPTVDERNARLETIEKDWGSGRDLESRAPTAALDPRFQQWWSTYLRMSASPGAALALSRMNSEIDIRHVLPAIRVPTLIVHRSGDTRLPVEGARYMAERIPEAKFVELPGIDHLPFAGDQDAILDEIELFLTGTSPVPVADRVLATIAAIEISGAADRAANLGDRQWHTALDSFDKEIAAALIRFRGERIKSTADGILASFDGPGRAIRFCCSVGESARNLGFETVAGIHTGECERTATSIAGIALHIATRIMYRSRPGQIVVSSTVKTLVVGSDIDFADAGSYVFPDLPGEWELFRVVQDHVPVSSSSGEVNAPHAVAHTSSPLSPREREIAALITQGLSNREIATELFISPATAERHVSNIFAKLGYHSRAQIAAWAVGHDVNTHD